MTTESVPDPTPPQGCELFLHTTQEGEATHLGHFTGAGSTCGFNGQFGVLEPPINPAGGPPPYFVSDFTIEQTYTAANGDELLVSGQGILVQSLTDGSAGFVGGGTLDGGTGRFEGATGVFDIEGIRGAFAHFDGWIVFDASNRRH